MDSRRAVLPNAQPTEVVQPGQGPLHVPSVLPQPATVGRPTPRDLRPDAAPSQPSAMRVGVKAPVSIEAVRTPPRPSRLTAHRRDRVDQRDHRIHIGDIGGGRLFYQWHPNPIRDHLGLSPLLGGMGPAWGGVPPPPPRPPEPAFQSGT